MDRRRGAFNPRPDPSCTGISGASGSGRSSTGVPLWHWRRTRKAPSGPRSCPLSTMASNLVERHHSRLWQKPPPGASHEEIWAQCDGAAVVSIERLGLVHTCLLHTFLVGFRPRRCPDDEGLDTTARIW